MASQHGGPTGSDVVARGFTDFRGSSVRGLQRGFEKPSDAPFRVKVTREWTVKNKHLRKFRNFALAYIAFRANVREALELGKHRRPQPMREKGGEGADAAPTPAQADPATSSLSMSKYLINEVDAKPWFIIAPDSWTRRSWELWMIAPMMYVAFVTPFRIFFNEEATGASANWEIAVYASFVLDMTLNFFFAYIDGMGNVENRPGLIARHYARTWLVLDVLATLPLDYVMDDSTAAQGRANELTRLARLPRALRLLRLLRLLKLARMGDMATFMRWLSADIHPAVGRLFSSAFWALLVLHLFAGIWFFLADQENGQNPDINTWVTYYHFDTSTVYTQYVVSLYFTTSTFVSLGIGDITPVTDGERIFAIIMMIFGLLWGAVLISTMSAVVNEMDRSSSDTKDKLHQLDSFAAKAHLPRRLKQRIRSYLDQADANDEQRASRYTQQQILEYLSPSLRQEVVLFSNAALLSRLPSLARQNPEVQAFIVERLRRQVAQPGEYVSVENANADSMYFLTKGKVRLTQDGADITIYGPGSYFGDIDCLFTPLRVASVQAMTACDIYVLTREHLHQTCIEFPAFGVFLRRVAVKRLRRYGELLGEPLMSEELLDAVEEELNHVGQPAVISNALATSGGSAIYDGNAAAALKPLPPTLATMAVTGPWSSSGSLAGVGLGATQLVPAPTPGTKPRSASDEFMKRVKLALTQKALQQQKEDAQSPAAVIVCGPAADGRNMRSSTAIAAATGVDVTSPPIPPMPYRDAVETEGSVMLVNTDTEDDATTSPSASAVFSAVAAAEQGGVCFESSADGGDNSSGGVAAHRGDTDTGRAGEDGRMDRAATARGSRSSRYSSAHKAPGHGSLHALPHPHNRQGSMAPSAALSRLETAVRIVRQNIARQQQFAAQLELVLEGHLLAHPDGDETPPVVAGTSPSPPDGSLPGLAEEGRQGSSREDLLDGARSHLAGYGTVTPVAATPGSSTGVGGDRLRLPKLPLEPRSSGATTHHLEVSSHSMAYASTLTSVPEASELAEASFTVATSGPIEASPGLPSEVSGASPNLQYSPPHSVHTANNNSLIYGSARTLVSAPGRPIVVLHQTARQPLSGSVRCITATGSTRALLARSRLVQQQGADGLALDFSRRASESVLGNLSPSSKRLAGVPTSEVAPTRGVPPPTSEGVSSVAVGVPSPATATTGVLHNAAATTPDVDDSGADGFYNLAPDSLAWRRSMEFRRIASHGPALRGVKQDAEDGGTVRVLPAISSLGKSLRNLIHPAHSSAAVHPAAARPSFMVPTTPRTGASLSAPPVIPSPAMAQAAVGPITPASPGGMPPAGPPGTRTGFVHLPPTPLASPLPGDATSMATPDAGGSDDPGPSSARGVELGSLLHPGQQAPPRRPAGASDGAHGTVAGTTAATASTHGRSFLGMLLPRGIGQS